MAPESLIDRYRALSLPTSSVSRTILASRWALSSWSTSSFFCRSLKFFLAFSRDFLTAMLFLSRLRKYSWLFLSGWGLAEEDFFDFLDVLLVAFTTGESVDTNDWGVPCDDEAREVGVGMSRGGRGGRGATGISGQS